MIETEGWNISAEELLNYNYVRRRAYVSLPMIHTTDFSFNRRYINIVESLGIKVVSKWVASPPKESKLTPHEVFKRDLDAISRSDLLIADVTHPSHGVGMEIMYAYMLGKKIIVTYKSGSKLSYMILGLPGAVLVEYRNINELECKLKKVLEIPQD